MTETQFEDRIKLGAVRGVRLIRVQANSPQIKFQVVATLSNGEIDSLHGVKGGLKLYRPDTALDYLAKLGLSTAVVDLEALRSPALL